MLIRLLFYSISIKIKVATELKTEHYLTLRLLNRSELITLTSVIFKLSNGSYLFSSYLSYFYTCVVIVTSSPVILMYARALHAQGQYTILYGSYTSSYTSPSVPKPLGPVTISYVLICRI